MYKVFNIWCLNVKTSNTLIYNKIYVTNFVFHSSKGRKCSREIYSSFERTDIITQVSQLFYTAKCQTFKYYLTFGIYRVFFKYCLTYVQSFVIHWNFVIEMAVEQRSQLTCDPGLESPRSNFVMVFFAYYYPCLYCYPRSYPSN